MLVAVVSVITKRWKPTSHAVGEWLNRLYYIHITEHNSAKKKKKKRKEANYWYTQEPGKFSRELCLVIKADPKVYIWGDSICITFLKWQNYRDGEQISGCQGLRGAWRREKGLWLPNGSSERSLQSWNCFVSCVNVSVPAVISYYSSANVFLVGKLGKI